MKKVIQRSIIIVLTVAMLIGLFPLNSQAAVTDKRSIISEYKLPGYPAFPKLKQKQQYFLIYEEGYRNDRVEVCFFDIVEKADLVHIMWQGKKKGIDIKYGKIANDEQYYLDTKKKKWIKAYSGWGQISSGATKIRCANMDVYNTSGNKIIKATKVKYLYFEKSKTKMDVGDCFTIKVKTNLTGLKYSSSDKTIASISSTTGKIRAKKAGTVTITAIASNGKKATCTVVVRKP